ncbi:phosphate signaling complex protein PhoU [Agrococcus casei]|uniref:Phosphate-specific transport system accessory protein PhoU n=1 Tax=Agrococcus casei LMG 22410 TaxID=1255656 RepID=A0A1R4EUQ0_9MICO|nr:phosphate signaling complex protein PhoU [Agrococcus casei]SJM47331.1 Phosphate transport system regulatory protein PhoU [Agrococcus casei LMG 22410]
MREVFQQELAEVQTRLVSISEAVETAIKLSHEALHSSDVQLAEKVIASDVNIDEQVDSLDEYSIDIMARQGPVARDLRIVVSSLRISASLERMGDLARHIATLSRYRFPEEVVPGTLAETFREMGQLDIQIAGLLVELLKTESVDVGDRIRQLDDEVDALHQRVFDVVLSDDWNEPSTVTVDMVLGSRYHERFADHAVSIAKKMNYLATGEWTEAEDDAE